MIYAQWTISRPTGTTPEPTIRSRGGQASGGFMIGVDNVVGFVWGNINLDGLEEWSFTQLTQDDALDKAKTIHPNCYISQDGTIQAPDQLIN